MIVNLLKTNKDAIKTAIVDEKNKQLILTKNNNNTVVADLTAMMQEVTIQKSDTYADLPDASTQTGKTIIVTTTTGIIGITRKQAGMYFSDGTSWRRLALNYNAEQTYYNNTGSDLSSTNTKAALDELDTKKSNRTEVYTKQEIDNAKEPKNPNIQNHITSKQNPHEINKEDIGLSNVDNTSDLNKPISNQTKAELIYTNNLISKSKIRNFLNLVH